MDQKISIHSFKQLNPELEEIFQDAFCRFVSNKEKKYILEKIYVEDNREVVHLYAAYEQIIKNPFYKQGSIITYHDVEYNHRDRTFEVLRNYYDSNLTQYMKKLKNKKISKELAVSFVLQIFQVLANIEQGGLTLLGLKPGNIFVIEKEQDITIKVGGFVRSDKFLLSQPSYQSKNLQEFVQECIKSDSLNIVYRYNHHSHSVCYTALLILAEFLLQKDVEELTNFANYLNASDQIKEASMSSEAILNQIELEFQGIRLFIEQAQLLLMTEEKFEPNGILAVELFTLASELRVEGNVILLGDFVQFKQEPVVVPIKPPQIQIKKVPVVPVKPPKRTGGGFMLKPKK